MIFRPSRARRAAGAKKPEAHALPFGLREAYRRLENVNTSLLTNHYWEQRGYIAAINMQYAIRAIPVLPEEKIRIHFLHDDAQRPPFWDSLSQACLADARLDVKGIALDAERGPAAATIRHGDAFSRHTGMRFIPYADYDPYRERPHILIYQNCLDELFLRFARCKANFIKKYGIRPVCFCGPEYDAPQPEAYKTLYQQHVQMFAWRIVAPRKEIREDFYRRCLPGGDAVLVVENMEGNAVRDGLLHALSAERERLAHAGSDAALRADPASLEHGMDGER